MADANPSSRGKWLWIAVLVLLAILALVFILNPSGDREGQVEDPIVTEEFGEPTAGAMQGDAMQGDMQNTTPGGMQGQDLGETAAPAPEPFAPGGDPE